MSKKVIQQVVMKAKEDPEFMKALMENPDVALKSYALTEEEIGMLKKMDEKALKGLSPSCFELADRYNKKKQ